METALLRAELEGVVRSEFERATEYAVGELVERLMQRFEDAQAATAVRTFVRMGISNRTHLDRVRLVLQHAGGKVLSSSEIARLAGIDAGAARMVLYQNRDLFETQQLSKGRVAWRLKELEELAV